MGRIEHSLEDFFFAVVIIAYAANGQASSGTALITGRQVGTIGLCIESLAEMVAPELQKTTVPWILERMNDPFFQLSKGLRNRYR